MISTKMPKLESEFVLRIASLTLNSAFFVTGCSGGGNVTPTAIVAAPQAHTSRIESLPNNGARIFLDNVLVDTITYATNGAAQHDFGGGKTVTDKVPVPQIRGMHTSACYVVPVAPAIMVNFQRSVTAYNQATMNLYLVLGGIAATTVITSGLAAVVLGASGMVAVYEWETARNDMYADWALTAGTYRCN